MDQHLTRPSVTEVTERDFEEHVLRSDAPVLVEFRALWSRPCQILDSVLDEIVPELPGRARLVKVNADDCLDLSLSYDIQSVPTLLYFVDGKPLIRIVGTASKQALLARLNALSAAT